MMRIIFFSHYYPPEVNAPASRTSEHCRIWARAGHSVTVITCAPNHPAGKIYPGYRNRLFQRETVDGVEVVRVWSYLAANEGFIRRTANYVSYMLTASLAMLRLPRPDVYVSTSPQFFCGLAGLVAKTLKRKPWVLEIRDLWPESIVTVGAMKRGMGTRFLEWLERLAYNKADQVIAVTDAFVPHIAERNASRTKIDVIKNGVDLTLFQRKPGDDTVAVKCKLGLEGRFVAAYVGTHGMAHKLDTILEAAALLKDDHPEIGFLLVGDGAERARLADQAAVRNLSNVRIAGQLPKLDMPGVWSATDVSLIVLKQSDTFKKVLPSKMFEAMAMSCPIVLGVEGEAKSLLDEADAGIAITPESGPELAAAVLKLALDSALCARLGQQGEKFVRENFDRARLAERYLAILERTAGTRTANATGRVSSGVSTS